MTYLTINGRVAVDRVVYWRKETGPVIPADRFLRIAMSSYSPGVREILCREAMHSSFQQAEDVKRVGQLSVSAEEVRVNVESEGRHVIEVQKVRELPSGWTARDCRESAASPSCVITGADGVLIPMVTQAEKQKRRANRQAGRKASSTKKHPGDVSVRGRIRRTRNSNWWRFTIRRRRINMPWERAVITGFWAG